MRISIIDNGISISINISYPFAAHKIIRLIIIIEKLLIEFIDVGCVWIFHNLLVYVMILTSLEYSEKEIKFVGANFYGSIKLESGSVEPIDIQMLGCSPSTFQHD